MMRDTLNTGARTVRGTVYENATEGVGDTITLTEDGYQCVDGIFEENPDTSSDWTMTEVDASEFGYEIVS